MPKLSGPQVIAIITTVSTALVTIVQILSGQPF